MSQYKIVPVSDGVCAAKRLSGRWIVVRNLENKSKKILL